MADTAKIYSIFDNAPESLSDKGFLVGKAWQWETLITSGLFMNL